MTITVADIVSLISSIASLLLSVLAIWLSITFFRMSSKEAKESAKSSSLITSSVDRLEKIFDKLYSDTFSMMKDTVTDMREHIWNKQDITNTSVVRTEDIKQFILDEINKLELVYNGDKIDKEQVINELTDLFETFSAKSNILDEDMILKYIYHSNSITVPEISKLFDGIDESTIASLMFHLRDQDLITWKGNKDSLTKYTHILPKREKIKEKIKL